MLEKTIAALQTLGFILAMTFSADGGMWATMS
jgi:hypothetical protein